MAGRLRAWWSLPWRDRMQLLAMMAALPGVSLMLALAGYVRSRRWIERLSPRAQPARAASAADLDGAQRLAWLLEIAGRRGAISATCLRQSLLLAALLRRRGLDPVLKLGVRKADGQFDAHAWVELDGTALGEQGLDHVPLPEPRAGGPWAPRASGR